MRLSLQDLRLRRDGALFRFDAEITESVTGVFGPSGAGKTTLLNLIAGLTKPDTGRILFNDRVLVDGSQKIFVPPERRRVGLIFQDHCLFPHLSVERNLRYSAPYRKTARPGIDFDTVTDLLDLSPLLQKMPDCLSGGEKQRVAVGRALLSQPELLLMDEPFSNLDLSRRRQISSFLLDIADRFDVPMLIISHDLDDLLNLTRSFLIVENGFVRASGNYLDIADAGQTPNLLSHRRFRNTPELVHVRHIPAENLNVFSLGGSDGETGLVTNSSFFTDKRTHGKRVRLSIAADDIALSHRPVFETSIQNQKQGTITRIRDEEHTCLVSVDCNGLELTAEVTRAAVRQMDLALGQSVFCLIKAKAVEVVHIFAD